MEVILLGDVSLDDRADTFVEIGQYLQEVLELLVDPPDQVRHLIPFGVVLGRGLQAMLQELGHIDRVVVLVGPADGEALGADHALRLAFRVDADEGGGLLVQVAVIGLYELFECLGESVRFAHFQ